MSELIKRFVINEKGRDIAVGDIHGCFSKLRAELDRIGFDETKDRLFSVGDLVDRGPECEDVIKWLNYRWFHPVRGNHDDYVCRFDTCDRGNWFMNGGGWFFGLPFLEQCNYQALFQDIPLAIEVETTNGLVGIVHADPCVSDWADLSGFFSNRVGRNSVMWSRSRFQDQDESIVKGVRAVVVGHTPIDKPECLGNVWHIDTAGWHEQGRFSLMDLNTLEFL